MTREEAINLLDNLIGMVEDNQQNDYDEAFKLAIKSLKSWDEDVAPVVHGEWIPSRFKTLREDGWCECSVCGVGNKLYDRGVRKSDVPHIDGKSYELKNIANYCPNCGARMDGAV